MKTEKDIIVLKESECNIGKGTPMGTYENQYQYYIELLYDYYISKLDGIDRIKYELSKWDEKSKEIILFDLIELINRNYVMYFNEQDFLHDIMS